MYGIVLVSLLDSQPLPEGSNQFGFVLLSVLHSCFLGIGSLDFCETQHGVRCPYGVVRDRAAYLGKHSFSQKWGKWTKNSDFLNLLENLVIYFFWIWSIKKVYIKCCILAQIKYLGKIWFLRYGLKWSRPIRLQDF